MTEQSPILKVRDVIAALEKRGRHEEAYYYSTVYTFLVGLMYGLSEEEIMDMTVDDLVELSNLPQKPLKYDGWSTFHFGRAAFGNSS